MKIPIISIIIPCFNHGKYIDDAIKSVEEYNNGDYEIIIINDGSTDEFTINRLLELKNKGYNVIFQENQGLGRTRNNGIRLAKGKYILPLDADNKIKPEYIIKAIEILETNSTFSIVYSDRQMFGEEINVIKVGEFDLPRILKENYIDACAIYRKNAWYEIGGYDENMPHQGFEDWDFWISAAEKGFKFYYIPEPFFQYRVDSNSMIHQLINSSNMNSLVEYIYKKHILINSRDHFWLKRIFISNNKRDNEFSNFHNTSCCKEISIENYRYAKRIIELIKINKLSLKYEIQAWNYYLNANPLIYKRNWVFFLVLIKRLYMPEPLKSIKIFRDNGIL